MHIEFVLVVDVRERWREYTAVLEIKTRHRAGLAASARNFQMLALHVASHDSQIDRLLWILRPPSLAVVALHAMASCASSRS